MCVCVCMSVCLSVCLSVCVPLCVSACVRARVSALRVSVCKNCMLVRVPVSGNACASEWACVYVCVCVLAVYLWPVRGV